MSNSEADPNYQYFVHIIKELPGCESLKVLDFGCGQGKVVSLLRQEGIECFGVDVFYAGASFESLAENPLFKSGVILAIPESGRLPFADKHFDVIISNQVLEHVKDKDSVLRELNRVLKDAGLMYHHFPSRECIREGHIGIPFAHWLPRGRFRYFYTLLLRSAGFGFFKSQLPLRDWTKRKLEWIDEYCYYERRSAIHNRLSREYTISYREIDYCRFRAKDKPLLKLLLNIDFMKGYYQRVFRRFGHVAIELRKSV